MGSQEVMSAEMFYPDCPNGHDGGIAVVVGEGVDQGGWRCLYCEEDFQTPEDSPWYGIGALNNDQRIVYINCVIRGKSTRLFATHGRYSTERVKELLHQANDRLRKAGRSPSATAASD